MRKLLYLVIFLGFTANIWAGTEPESTLKSNNPRKPKARPSLPGNLVLEFGSNLLMNSPENFDISLLGSRAFGFYYQYEMRIGTSSFAFAPGVGLGLQRYKFTNNFTLDYQATALGTVTVEMVPTATTFGDVKKSMLVTNYVDLPLEFRFYGNPEDKLRSFHVSVAGYIGYLFDAQTKIKYQESGETKILKDKQNYNLNPIRYGAHLRIGVGGFNVFGRYNFSPLFSNNGPGGTDFNNVTVGLSVIGF